MSITEGEKVRMLYLTCPLVARGRGFNVQEGGEDEDDDGPLMWNAWLACGSRGIPQKDCKRRQKQRFPRFFKGPKTNARAS